MRKYPKYKDSGAIWVGNIPELWDAKRIKHITYVKGRIGWQGMRSDEFLDDSDSYVVTGTDFDNGRIKWETCHQVPIERYDEDPFIQLKNDDLLITKDGTIGKVALVKQLPKIATLNSGVFLTRPKDESYSNAFMYWVLISDVFKTFYDFHKSGSTIQHLYQNVFDEFKFPIPPLAEQQQIVTYLDQKTTLIDQIISGGEKKIELLKEQRTATINHAVTKGLNPKVKMKDSEVEWIGEIPEGWEVKKYKHVSEVVTGNTPSKTNGEEYYTEGELGFLWVKPTNLLGAQYVNKSEEKLTELGKKHVRIIPRNSVMICCIGNTIGKYGMSGEELSTNQQINTVIPDESEILAWYCLYFTDVFTRDLLKWSNFVTLPIYTKSDLEDTPIIVPPLHEQQQIVTYLDQKTKEIDDLIASEKKRIELMKEYRKSLISEVVTGKIKITN
jgi:type I restriction enzyme S subunit